MSNENVNRCPKCQAPLPADAPQGLCPKCLLAAVSTPTETGQSPEKNAPRPIHEVVAAFPQLEIIELIGQGGMGVVYKARQPKLDRVVALKLLSQALATDPAFAERFHREARLLARLNHPNIVSVYDYGEVSGFYYLLMEYVDGINLRQALQGGRFTPQQALALVPKICEALQFAHEEGILHRDIKPENILLDTRGRIKIADFGIAKLLGDKTRETALTAIGAAIGTPQYMAPEQLEHRQDIDQRADIYSLGVVFYEMLTGELPLGHFAPPSQKSAVDPRVDEVVLRALAKEREKRFGSAGEVKTEVEHITESAPKLPHETETVSQGAKEGAAGAVPPPLVKERRSTCYLSTPERMRNCFPGPSAHIFICKGELLLAGNKLVFTDPWRTRCIIPLDQIQDLSIAQFKMWHTPWVMKYERFNFLSITIYEQGRSRIYHLTPVKSALNSAEANDPYVTEWYEAIRAAITTCTGAAPQCSEPSKVSVSAQPSWNRRAVPLLVALVLSALILPRGVTFIIVIPVLAMLVGWFGFGFMQANQALRRGDLDAVTSNEPPPEGSGASGPTGTVITPEATVPPADEGYSPTPPPKRRSAWRYALWFLPILLLAPIVILFIFMFLPAFMAAKFHVRHSQSQTTPARAAEAVLERVTVRDTGRFPGLRAFSWGYSIPANHVALFNFTFWSNGVPQMVEPLSCWVAGRVDRVTKGNLHWSVQDGVMLSPELRNHERWDFKREVVRSRQTETGGGSFWTLGILGSGGIQFSGGKTVRLGAGSDPATLLDFGETNAGVVVQAWLEKIPEGSATLKALSGQGTNWLGSNQITTSASTGVAASKTMVLTGVTNYLHGPYASSQSELGPGETVLPVLKYADGQMEEAISVRSTYWRGGDFSTLNTLSWSFPDAFGPEQIDAAVSQIRFEKAERPLTLTAGEPLPMFSVTNSSGAVLEGYLKYSKAVPEAQAEDTTNAVEATAQFRSVTDILGQSFYAIYSPTAPAGYAILATAKGSSGDRVEATTTINRSASMLQHQCSWTLPKAFGKEQAASAEGQLKGLVEQGAIQVKSGEPRMVFSVTNSTGEVYQGFLELVGARTKQM